MIRFNKKIIQNKFNRASTSYDSVAGIQKECAQILTQLLKDFNPDFYPQSILDLGCGTGYMLDNLCPFFPDSSYIINDIAVSMLECVESKWKTRTSTKPFSFYLGDMEEMPFEFYNLIVSNFALQWAHHLESMLVKCYSHSDYFAFSTLLSGTFKEWVSLLQKNNFSSSVPLYPSFDELQKELLKLKPLQSHFLVKDFQMIFKNAKEFIKYLKSLGASIGSPIISLRQAALFNEFIKNHNAPLTITYQVFFGLLKRG